MAAKPNSKELETVQGRFRANAREVCKRVMNVIRRVEKKTPESRFMIQTESGFTLVSDDKRPSTPKLDDLQKILNTLDDDTKNPLTPEILIGLFFEGSFKIWDSIFIKDKKTLMGIISTLIPNVSKEAIASYQNLLIIKIDDKMIIDEEEEAWFWKFFHQMVRQCISYGLSLPVTNGKVAITKTFSLTRKELEELKQKWETTDQNKAKAEKTVKP